jgi:hypothetical protein
VYVPALIGEPLDLERSLAREPLQCPAHTATS